MKEAQKKVKEEEAEKERFLNLSDREKRALAAERRLLGASSSSSGYSSLSIMFSMFIFKFQ